MTRHLSSTYVWDPSAIPRSGRRLGARPPTGRRAAGGTTPSRWADGGGRFGGRRRTLRRGRTSATEIKKWEKVARWKVSDSRWRRRRIYTGRAATVTTGRTAVAVVGAPRWWRTTASAC